MTINAERPSPGESAASKIGRLLFKACLFIPTVIGTAVLRLVGVDTEVRRPASGRNASGGTMRVFPQYKWPQIYKTERGYLLKAAHESPRRETWPGRLSIPTAIAACFVIAAFIPPVGYGEVAEIIGGGIVIGWISLKAIWPKACYVQLRIWVENGSVRWHEPAGKMVIIGPTEPYEIILSAPHRLAPVQARINAALQQNHRNKHNPPPLPVKYLAASEVFAGTGEDLQFTHTVADIAYDSVGRRGLALRAALDRVVKTNRKEVDDAKSRQRSGGWTGRHR